jgi:hypothetical protein
MCHTRALLLLSLLMASLPTLAARVAVQAAPGATSVFPLPGSRYNRPATQISFAGWRTEQSAG